MNHIVADTPFSAWQALNIGMVDLAKIAEWCPSFNPNRLIADRYSFYDVVVEIESWVGVHQPFIELSQEDGIPYFPGYRNLPKKMTALANMYLDWDKVDELHDYLWGRTFPKGGAPGLTFEASTLMRHGSCLTAFQVIRTSHDVVDPQVRIFIRASELSLIFFADR